MRKKDLWNYFLVLAIVVIFYAAIVVEPNTAAMASSEKKPAETAMPTPAVDGNIEKFTDGNAVWTYNHDTKCLVISGQGKISTYGRNENMWDEDMDMIPWNMFKKHCYRPDYAGSVKKIVIEPGITSINTGAFYEYASLETVEISDTVEEMEEYVFWYCRKLKKVTLGDHVKKINEGTFMNCTSLSEIAIGKGVEEIDKFAFFRCSALKKITLDPENTNLISESGVLYDRERTVLYHCMPGKKENVKIPKSVRKITGGAFSGCKRLKKISFEKGSKCSWIGRFAFYGCLKLQGMSLPDAVQYVGNEAFEDCKSLRQISLGRSFVGFTWEDTLKQAKKKYQLPSQSHFADGFLHGKIRVYKVSRSNPRYSSRDGVLYNKDKTKLLCYPQEKKTKTVRIANSVQVIQKGAFQSNRYIKELILPRSVKKIGGEAFSDCKKLKTVTLNDSPVIIGSYAFCRCRSLSKVNLGNRVRKINRCAFYSTKFKEIYIPSSVVTIGEKALGKGSDEKRLPGGTMRYTEREVSGFKIYGKRGSAAERYAKYHGYDFVAR